MTARYTMDIWYLYRPWMIVDDTSISCSTWVLLIGNKYHSYLDTQSPADTAKNRKYTIAHCYITKRTSYGHGMYLLMYQASGHVVKDQVYSLAMTFYIIVKANLVAILYLSSLQTWVMGESESSKFIHIYIQHIFFYWYIYTDISKFSPEKNYTYLHSVYMSCNVW